MKTLRVLLAGLLITTTSLFASSVANAGQINAIGATISWDDSTLYTPNSCSTFKFNVAMDSSIWQVTLSINNKYGDIVASSSSTYGSGQISLQVCTGKDLTGTVLIAVVTTQQVVKSIYEKPIAFLSRSGSPSTTLTPAPAPTVTVTATPAPASTVYITNPSDKNLADLVTSLKSQVKLLNAKVKRICSVKPKPKGC